MKSEFEIAITQLCSDRNLSPNVIIEAIEMALVTAYKRNYSANQNVAVQVDPHTGQARVFIKKIVVENVNDEFTEISLAEARSFKPDAVIGDTVDLETQPRDFGRIAAQTAKQVIMQRIREAERDQVYDEYTGRVGEIANGIVRNVDSRSHNVTVNLGKVEAMLPQSEQIPGEFYRFNQRLRVYIMEVDRGGHGPQIVVSRTHRGLLRRLLELEVPEIYNGTVEIKAIAREPGSRSKVAVAALQPGVDPVGSCVGMRGVRIQNIVNELNGEKIDVVAWSSDVEAFIGSALSPAKVVSVYLNNEEKTAKVVVPDRSLSLAIGKEGQNARLAAKLTGWRIDIRSETEASQEAKQMAAEAEEAALRARELEAARQAAAELLAEAQASLDEEEAEMAPVAQEAEEAPALEEIEEAEAIEAEFDALEGEPEVEEEPIHVEQEELLAPDQESSQEPEEEIEEYEEIGTTIEDEEDESSRRSKGQGKKKKDRQLEYDDRLGRVVARKKRKPSRSRGWADDEDDWS